MGIYRESRNIETSILQYLESELSADWSNVAVEKAFAEIQPGKSSVLIRSGDTIHDKVEIGDNLTTRNPQILIEIYGTSSGNTLDMKDYIISKIKNGCPYYQYEIENSQIKTKTLIGRIRVLDIDDTPINFGVDKDGLEILDRYRWLITLSVSTGQVEE